MKTSKEYGEEFIKKATIKHNGKYDYSKVDYVNKKTKVIITCPIHGDFKQIPSNHVKGAECPKCGRITAGAKSRESNPTRLSKDEFEKRSIEKHGKKYDYSKVVYVNQYEYVPIICPIHGEFKQSPKRHMRGQGCPKCGVEYARKWRKYNSNGFLESAKKRFKDRYDYPKIHEEYENSHSKITIKCNRCGNEFIKIACDHITSNNGGCQTCYKKVKSSIEEEIRQLLIDNKIEFVCEYRNRELLGTLTLDFYLPKHNIAIECQGSQHFTLNEYFGGEKEFKKTQFRDNKKRILCEKNDIKLLYYSNLNIEYPYQVYEDKEKLLKEIIKNE